MAETTGGDKPAKQSGLGQFSNDTPHGHLVSEKLLRQKMPLEPLDEETIKFIHQTQRAVEEKLPITWLNEPEAHEDALKAGRDLWAEGMSILDRRDMARTITKDASGEEQFWTIYSAKAIGSPVTPPDADLAITTYQVLEEEVSGEMVQYKKYTRYFLTPRGVVLIEKNAANTLGAKSEPRPPKEKSIRKEELGRDEINVLLHTLEQAREVEYPDGTTKTRIPQWLQKAFKPV